MRPHISGFTWFFVTTHEIKRRRITVNFMLNLLPRERTCIQTIDEFLGDLNIENNL